MAGETYDGRHRGDVQIGELPDNVQPGDYWRIVNAEGEPIKLNEPSNLTGEMWMFRAPVRGGIGTLTKHTVRSHEDGTASIRPNDGSSNSVLITGAGGEFHGYLEHGIWRAV